MMDWLDLPAVQGTLKSLLQHHSLRVSVVQCSAFFMVQLSHPYVTPGKTITLTIWTFVKGFGIVNESEVGGFGEFSCVFYVPAYVGNLKGMSLLIRA